MAQTQGTPVIRKLRVGPSKKRREGANTVGRGNRGEGEKTIWYPAMETQDNKFLRKGTGRLREG